VLGDRGSTQVEFLHQFPGGAIALGEKLDDASAGGIGDGSKAVHVD
jgi:hypothetical protein